MKLITIKFGVGASFFALEREENGKLIGFRWNGGDSCWGNRVKVAASERTDRWPSCTVPNLPDADDLARADALAAKRAAAAKERATILRQVKQRLARGEAVRVQRPTSVWTNGKRAETTEILEVVGVDAGGLLIPGPYGYNVRLRIDPNCTILSA